MQQYITPGDPHASPLELEADRYSVNHGGHPKTHVGGEANLKRGLRETYKFGHKDLEKLCKKHKISDEQIDLYHKAYRQDGESRKRALKDPKIRDYYLYK